MDSSEPPDNPDDTLVKRVFAGDPSALDELYRICKVTVLAAIGTGKLPLTTPEDHEEIIQEVARKAIMNLKTFDFRSRLKTWVRAIIENQIIDCQRRRHAKKRPQFVHEDIDEVIVQDEAALPDVERERVENARKIIQVISEALGEDWPIVVLVAQGYSRQEVADMTEVSLSTLAGKLARARAMVRAIPGVRALLRARRQPSTHRNQNNTKEQSDGQAR